MAKTIREGYYLAASGSSATLHTAPGRLLAVLVSHSQSSSQAVTFYNNTAASGTVILVLDVQPTQSPYFLQFERNAGIPFDTALHVAQGSCDVCVWSVDHG